MSIPVLLSKQLFLNTKKATLFAVAGFVAISLTYSCARKSPCKTGGLNLHITDLDSTLDDTIVIEKYAKGSNFSAFVDSNTLIFIDSLDMANGIENNVLVLMGQSKKWHGDDKNNPGYLSADYDYVIKTGHFKYYFSEMSVTQKTKKCGRLLSLECPECFSPVTQFKLNNISHSITENEPFSIQN